MAILDITLKSAEAEHSLNRWDEKREHYRHAVDPRTHERWKAFHENAPFDCKIEVWDKVPTLELNRPSYHPRPEGKDYKVDWNALHQEGLRNTTPEGPLVFQIINNQSAEHNLIPLTPWTMTHRLYHAMEITVARRKKYVSALGCVEEIGDACVDAVDAVLVNMKREKNLIPNSKKNRFRYVVSRQEPMETSVILGYLFGTFRSARQFGINTGPDAIAEFAAQMIGYKNIAKISREEFDKRVDWIEEVTGNDSIPRNFIFDLRDEVIDQLENEIRKVIDSSVGQVMCI